MADEKLKIEDSIESTVGRIIALRESDEELNRLFAAIEEKLFRARLFVQASVCLSDEVVAYLTWSKHDDEWRLWITYRDDNRKQQWIRLRDSVDHPTRIQAAAKLEPLVQDLIKRARASAAGIGKAIEEAKSIDDALSLLPSLPVEPE